MLCISGGQFYNSDESIHFDPGLSAVGTLMGGDMRSTAVNLLSEQRHAGFRVPSFLLTLAAFGMVGDRAYGMHWLLAWILSLASVAVIGLVYLLARRTGAAPTEATCAAVLAASATTLAMYARHLMPYDTG